MMMILLLEGHNDNHHVQSYEINHKQNYSCPKENNVSLSYAFSENNAMMVMAIDTYLTV